MNLGAINFVKLENNINDLSLNTLTSNMNTSFKKVRQRTQSFESFEKKVSNMFHVTTFQEDSYFYLVFF